MSGLTTLAPDEAEFIECVRSLGQDERIEMLVFMSKLSDKNPELMALVAAKDAGELSEAEFIASSRKLCGYQPA